MVKHRHSLPRIPLSSLGKRSAKARANTRARLNSAPAFEELEPRNLLTIGSPEGHIHAHLSIFIGSTPVVIPANVGVGTGLIAPLHTHDNSGLLHAEPDESTFQLPQGQQFAKLGNLFEYWHDNTNSGQAGPNPNAIFNRNQILNNVADSTHVVRMFVNGLPNNDFENYTLLDGDQIVIRYDTVANLNSPVFNPSMVRFTSNLGSFDLEMYDTIEPTYVANFLNYVRAGDYTNSIIHRVAKINSNTTPFVIQGGGFTSSALPFTSFNQFTSIPTDPAIADHLAISNHRGTIAMAKSGPNTTTSQWFVNQGANTFLDSPANSGGFTVFGRVIGTTTSDNSVVESIGNQSRPHLNNASAPSVFREIPITASNDVVRFSSISELENASIRGTLFNDLDFDGVRDAGEAGVQGISVFIDADNDGSFDVGEVNVTSDADGDYALFGLAPGTYNIRTIQPSGRAVTGPAGAVHTIVLAHNQDFAGRDFGTALIGAPSAPDLTNLFDDGASATDNNTSRNNSSVLRQLQFLVANVINGASVQILADGTPISAAVTAVGSTVTITTNGTTPLSLGAHNITAVQTLNGSASAASSPLQVTISGLPTTAMPTFQLTDVNPNSATANQSVSPTNYVNKISAWYFIHTT